VLEILSITENHLTLKTQASDNHYGKYSVKTSFSEICMPLSIIYNVIWSFQWKNMSTMRVLGAGRIVRWILATFHESYIIQKTHTKDELVIHNRTRWHWLSHITSQGVTKVDTKWFGSYNMHYSLKLYLLSEIQDSYKYCTEQRWVWKMYCNPKMCREICR